MRIVKVTQDTSIPIKVLSSSAPVAMGASITADVPYKGSTVFVPSDVDQIINIAGMKSAENIVVKAIPNDYGKISWNGAVLSIF